MELIAIQNKVFTLRGQKVMLDFDLAEMYEVETRSLKQAVRRNIDRFPEDFMFELTKTELEIFEITKCDLKVGEVSAFYPLLLPNKEWLCYPVF